MGDWFQNLVAPNIAAPQAKAVGGRMLGWLVAEEIVSAETKDCVLGADLGHPPGPQYAKATGKPDPHLLSLWTNGLAVISKRTVFHSGQGGFELICSACKSKFEPPDRWGDAVDEWFKQSGPGDLACPVGGVSRSVDEWQHDPPWAFGELGFEFWNWPQFTQAFVDEFEKRLGSRIVHVYGKL
jgi:hypothetical protein